MTVNDDKVRQENIISNVEEISNSGMTLRIIVISLIAMGLFGWAIVLGEYGIRRAIDTGLQPSLAGLTMILLLSVVTLIGKKSKIKALQFSKQEMVVIYGILGITSLIFSGGFIRSLPASIVGTGAGALGLAANFAKVRTYGPIFDKMSSLITPKSEEAIIGAWLGCEAAGIKGVPWGEWFWPIVVWTIYFFVVFWVVLCFGTMLRRRWIEHEKMTYPLTAPILETMDLSNPSKRSSEKGMSSKSLLYIGIILSSLQVLAGVIHTYYPSIPSLECPWVGLGRGEGIFAEGLIGDAVGHYPRLWFHISPIVLGVMYLIPGVDLLFSMWITPLLVKLATVFTMKAGLLNKYGQWGPYGVLNRRLGMGALVILALYILYSGRFFLKQAFYSAIGKLKASEVQDSEQPISPKIALITGCLGLLLLILFHITLLDMSLIVTLYYLAGVMLPFLAFLYIRAGTGLPISQALPTPWTEDVLSLFDYNIQSKTGWANFSNMAPFTFFDFAGIPAVAMDSYKMASDVGVDKRKLTITFCIAFILAAILAFVIVLPMVYDGGLYSFTGSNWDIAPQYTNWWLVDCPDSDFISPTIHELVVLGAGAAFTVLLIVLRTRFAWFPYHPAGFAALHTDWAFSLWGTIFLAWLIKSLVFRYGGASTYRKSTGLFLGIVIGSVAMNAIVSILGL